MIDPREQQQIEATEGDHSGKGVDLGNKQSKWWWYIIQFDTEGEAIAWKPPPTPKTKYIGWRAHAAPTTGKPHVHVLGYYSSAVRFKSLAAKKYCHMRFLETTRDKIHCRNYLLTDVHKDGSPKNPLAPINEEGEWPEKETKSGARKLGNQGDREDLIGVRDKIRAHKRKADLYKDDDLVEVIAKFPKFVNDMWNTREGKEVEVDMSMGLQPWQVELEKALQGKPKTRRIYWVWSLESNTGKNVFMNYLIYVKKMNVLVAPTKFADLMHMYDGHDIIWFDCTRATDDVEYSGDKFKKILLKNIENCSNHGAKSSGKYEGYQKNMVAHVVVTSNMAPPTTELPDRIVAIYATPLKKQPEPEDEDDKTEEYHSPPPSQIGGGMGILDVDGNDN